MLGLAGALISDRAAVFVVGFFSDPAFMEEDEHSEFLEAVKPLQVCLCGVLSVCASLAICFFCGDNLRR